MSRARTLPRNPLSTQLTESASSSANRLGQGLAACRQYWRQKDGATDGAAALDRIALPGPGRAGSSKHGSNNRASTLPGCVPPAGHRCEPDGAGSPAQAAAPSPRRAAPERRSSCSRGSWHSSGRRRPVEGGQAGQQLGALAARHGVIRQPQPDGIRPLKRAPVSRARVEPTRHPAQEPAGPTSG